MNTAFAFLAVASFIALVIGLFRPRAVRATSRGRAALIYGAIWLVGSVGFAATENPEAVAAREAEQETVRVERAARDSALAAEEAAKEAARLRDDRLLMAFVMCEGWVEEQLRAPSTAEFPAGARDFVVEVDDSTYLVRAYVDAQNAFGAQIRSDFECLTRPDGNGERWRLVGLEIQ